MTSRYSCPLAGGGCERDFRGRYDSEDKCNTDCQTVRVGRDMARSVLDFIPRDYLNMSPSDIIDYIRRKTGVTVEPNVCRSVLYDLLQPTSEVMLLGDHNYGREFLVKFIEKYGSEENMLRHFRKTYGPRYGQSHKADLLNSHLQILTDLNIGNDSLFFNAVNRGDIPTLEKLWLLGLDEIDYLTFFRPSHSNETYQFLYNKYPALFRIRFEESLLYSLEPEYDIEEVSDVLRENGNNIYLFALAKGWFNNDDREAILEAAQHSNNQVLVNAFS